MTIQLPNSIAAYFEAERDGGPDAVAATFTEDGRVRDEGNTHVGHAAIREWQAKVARKYAYTAHPFFIRSENGKTQVTCHVVGDFPGSPVDLRYFFVLAGDK